MRLAEQVGSGWDLPAEVRDQVDFHWFHVVPGRSLRLVILSGAPLWYVGHFVKGRMRKCSGEGCGFCELGIGSQVRYVFGGVEPTTRTVGVVEVGKSVAQLMRSWADRVGGLRWMQVEFQKVSAAKQSRMEVQLVSENPPHWSKALECPDLAQALFRTWERQGGG